MDQFFDRHKLLKLTHGEIDNLKRFINIKEIQSIFNVTKKKALGPHGFLGKFIHKSETMPICTIFPRKYNQRYIYVTINFMDQLG